MKFPFFLLMFCSLAITPKGVSQEWMLRNPLPTNANLEDCYLISPDTGFVCGQYQTILKTTDGGQTWQQKGFAADNTLNGIAFSTRDTGFAVGWYGSILRTSDCGETWQQLPQPFPAYFTDLCDIFFLDSRHGWICGLYHSILRTLDGGVTWDVLSHDMYTEHNYQIIKFLTPDTGFVAGLKYQYDYGVLKKTVDGGLTWNEIQIPAEIEIVSGLEIINFKELWIASGDQIGSPNGAATRIYHTLDGGLTWMSTDLLYFGPTVTSIKFFNVMHGIVSCEYRVFITSDGGVTWNEHLISNDRAYLVSTVWADTSTCLSVGYEGYIFKSEDGGQKWNEMSKGPKSNFNDICFTDSQNGFVVGYTMRFPWTIPVLYRTSDGGETWENTTIPVDTNSSTARLKRIKFSSASNGWAVGLLGLMLHTTDAGLTWNQASSRLYIHYYALELFTDKYIWVGGSASGLRRSTDYGDSWQNISLSYTDYRVDQIDFTDSLNGYLTLINDDYGLMFRSTDGGINWSPVVYVNEQRKKIQCMEFTDPETGFICIKNEGLAKTMDGGDTWIWLGTIEGVVPDYLKFTSAEHGLAVKRDHFIAFTQNGGDTWDILLNTFSTSMYVRDYFFIGLNQGWLTGDDGLIKSYISTGVGTPDLNHAQKTGPVIFPNPSGDILSILSDSEIRQVIIYDALGQMVKNISGFDLNTINISDLTQGLYIISLRDNRGGFLEKFIKK